MTDYTLKVKVTLWLTLSQSVSFGVFNIVWQLWSCFFGGAPSHQRGQVCLLYMLLALASAVFLGSKSHGSVFCICCWPLPVQSFSGPSPKGLSFVYAAGPASAVFLGSKSLGTRNRILLWDFPFCHLLWLAGSWWRYSTPPPNGYFPTTAGVLII
jgi:hypothetical protein